MTREPRLAVTLEALERETTSVYAMCDTVPPDAFDRLLRAVVWRCYMNGLRDGFVQGVQATT